MSCVNSSCCCCQGCAEPVSASGSAIDAATCATTGTNDTANALIAQAGSVIGTVVKQVGQSQRLGVKAQTQIATTATHSVTLIILGIAAIIAFVYFGGKRING